MAAQFGGIARMGAGVFAAAGDDGAAMRAQTTMNRLAPLLLAAARRSAAGVRPAAERTTAGGRVYFSPLGGCTDAVVREIRAAKTSIRVLAYSFTSTRIADALIDAQRPAST